MAFYSIGERLTRHRRFFSDLFAVDRSSRSGNALPNHPSSIGLVTTRPEQGAAGPEEDTSLSVSAGLTHNGVDLAGGMGRAE